MKHKSAARDTDRANVQALLKELREALGQEWVIDDPSVIAAYGGVFAGPDGLRPEIVVFPSSGREFEAVRRIAGKYGRPLFSMTKAFDHTDSVVPGRGGVLADLRRMDIVGG